MERASRPAVIVSTEWPVKWHGEWISAPTEEKAPDIFRTAITPEAERHTYERVAFRTEIDLTEVPEKIPARLTADSRYRFTIGGKLVGSGPIRSQPDRLHFDEFDLATHLIAGRNEVEIIVTFYGRPNAIWQPARSGSGLGDRATLVFETEIAGNWFVSGSGWTAQRLAEWSTLSELDSTARVPFEALDESAPAAPLENALARRVNHMGGLSESRPPTMPYGRLFPRSIGALGGETKTPSAVGVQPLGSPAEPAPRAPLPRIIHTADGAADSNFDISAERPKVAVAPGHPSLVKVDMGRIVFGYSELQWTADNQCRISTALTEKLLSFDPSEATGHIAGNIWVKAAGTSTFQAMDKNGFRYAYILIEADKPTILQLDKFEVHEDFYALTGTSTFLSSDEELVRIYQAGRRTTELNSHDAFVDCPTREQRAWTGDAYIHAAVHLACSDDWRLVRRSLELANSPRSDGLLPMASSADLEYIDNVTIPDWSLYWVHSLRTYFSYSGDTDFVRETLPTARRIIRWFLNFRAPENGLVGFTTEWNLVDWSGIFLDGFSSVINGLLGRALLEYGELSDAIGNSGDATWAIAEHGRLADAFEQFWDPERRRYLDHIDGKNASIASSQLSNSCAVLGKFVPDNRRDDIVASLSLGDHSVYRNWVGENGGYSQRRRRLHLLGIQEIDWDLEQGIMRAEPFGSALVHDALHQLNAHDELVRNIRQWSVFLHDGYDTFGECWGFGTPCHGWSSYPTASLVKYVLGICPGSPGFATATISPRYDLLDSAEGEAPSPAGPVRVVWSDNSLEVSSPVPFELVHPDGRRQQYNPGATRITVRTRVTPKATVASR